MCECERPFHQDTHFAFWSVRVSWLLPIRTLPTYDKNANDYFSKLFTRRPEQDRNDSLFSGSRRANCSQTLSSKLSHTAVHSQSHSATQVKAADVRTPTDSVFSFSILFSSATTNTRHTKAQRQQHTERQRRREQQAAC